MLLTYKKLFWQHPAVRPTENWPCWWVLAHNLNSSLIVITSQTFDTQNHTRSGPPFYYYLHRFHLVQLLCNITNTEPAFPLLYTSPLFCTAWVSIPSLSCQTEMVRIGSLQCKQRDVTSERTQTAPCTWCMATGSGWRRRHQQMGPHDRSCVTSWGFLSTTHHPAPAETASSSAQLSARCSQHSVSLKVWSRSFQFPSLSISKVPIHLI